MMIIQYRYKANIAYVFQPLMSSEEFERTKEIVAEFGKPGGVGEELQRGLLERAKIEENWVWI